MKCLYFFLSGTNSLHRRTMSTKQYTVDALKFLYAPIVSGSFQPLPGQWESASFGTESKFYALTERKCLRPPHQINKAYQLPPTVLEPQVYLLQVDHLFIWYL